MKKVIPSEVLDVLKQSQCEGNQLHLPRQLSRDIYVQTAKIIELLGGKWNRSFGAHVFEGDCAERVDEAVMAGEVTDFQKLYQFYETPPELARAWSLWRTCVKAKRFWNPAPAEEQSSEQCLKPCIAPRWN